MTTVNRQSLNTTIARLTSEAKQADIQHLVSTVDSRGNIHTKAVAGADGNLNSFEMNQGTHFLSTADRRALYSVYTGSLNSDGRSDTAAITDMQRALAAAAKKLEKADKNGNGIVEWNEVFTAGGNPKAGIGQMAAKLFVATQND